MSIFTTVWTHLSNIGDALEASGHFDTFYAGGPDTIPNAQKRVLVLEAVREDDQNLGVDNPWTATYELFVMMSEPRGKTDQLIGSTDDPGLGILVNLVRETLAINLENYGTIDHYELGEVNYGRRRSHPVRVAHFSLSVNGYLNPRARQSSGSASIVVPELQAQNLGDLGDVSTTGVTNGQVIAYNSSTGNWEPADNSGGGGGGTWGSITGTLSDQTDLQTELDAKLEDIGLESIGDLGDVTVAGVSDGDYLQYNSGNARWEPVSAVNRIFLPAYIEKNGRGLDHQIHGGFNKIADAQTLTSVSSISATAGASKVFIAVLAGSDFSGTMTITGDTVDRNTGSVTSGDTDTITVNALTTDLSSTDSNGNTIHGFTAGYLTSKWFTGGITISTSDLNLSDVDVYTIAYEQFNDRPTVTLDTFDITTYITNAAARFNAYLYSITWNAGKGSKYDITTVSSLEMNTPTADKFYRLRRGNLATSIDGTKEGVWVDVHFRPVPQQYFEDTTIKVWARTD